MEFTYKGTLSLYVAMVLSLCMCVYVNVIYTNR